MTPPDSRWSIWVSTDGPLKKLQRAVARQKFYTSLDRKLDNAIDDWKATQPDDTPKPIHKEDGWNMSIHSPWSDNK